MEEECGEQSYSAYGSQEVKKECKLACKAGTRDKIKSSKALPPVTYFLQPYPTFLQFPPLSCSSFSYQWFDPLMKS